MEIKREKEIKGRRSGIERERSVHWNTCPLWMHGTSGIIIVLPFIIFFIPLQVLMISHVNLTFNHNGIIIIIVAILTMFANFYCILQIFHKINTATKSTVVTLLQTLFGNRCYGPDASPVVKCSAFWTFRREMIRVVVLT